MKKNIEIVRYKSLDETQKKWWDEFLYQAHCESKFNNSIAGSEFHREIFGYEPTYFEIKINNEIKAIFIGYKNYRGKRFILRTKLPKFIKKIINSILNFLLSYLVVLSPIAFKKDTLDLEVDDIYLCLLGGKSKVIDKCIIYNIRNIKNLTKIKIKKWCSYIIDTSLNHEEIFRNFSKSTQKEIRRSIKNGVIVERLSTEKSIAEWVNWINNPIVKKESNKDLYVNYEFFLNFFKSVSNKNHYTVEVFASKLNDKIIGSLMILGYGDLVTEYWVYNDPIAKAEKIYTHELIKYEVCKYCNTNQISYFDLAGYNPNPLRNDKESGIFNFKSKFGGYPIEYILIR